MTQNLLTQRLKAVKRELTALKTAHRRGFGNVKIFVTPFTPTTDRNSGYLNLVIRFGGSAFPFVQILGTMDNSGDSNISPIASQGGGYMSDGLTYKQSVYWYSTPSKTIYIMTTEPIDSITYTWGR